MQKLLYDRYASKMYAICLRYSNIAIEAEENLKQGFIQVFKFIDTYQGQDFEGWLYKFFVHASLSNKRMMRKIYIYLNYNALVIKRDMTNLDMMNEKKILKLLQNLPHGYGGVFNMYTFDNLTCKQISGIMYFSDSKSRSELVISKKYFDTISINMN